MVNLPAVLLVVVPLRSLQLSRGWVLAEVKVDKKEKTKSTRRTVMVFTSSWNDIRSLGSDQIQRGAHHWWIMSSTNVLNTIFYLWNIFIIIMIDSYQKCINKIHFDMIRTHFQQYIIPWEHHTEMWKIWFLTKHRN